jgi:hypothetical protein
MLVGAIRLSNNFTYEMREIAYKQAILQIAKWLVLVEGRQDYQTIMGISYIVL